MRIKLKRKADIGIALILLLLALVPRTIDLGVFLTADEKNWIGRSYEFVRAFKDWRFNDMLQTTHPGVTTLWLTGIAVTGRMWLSHIPFSFQNLIHFVVAAQLPIALANALAVPAMYLLLRKLFPQSALLPAVAAGIIALDPFLIGYSRVVHVDALLASLLFLAALATLLYVRKDYSRRWLLASALLTGLAVLTKAPAIFALPFFWLVVLAQERGGLFTRVALLARARDFTLWLIIIGLLFVALWPAMLWVPNPEGNVLVLKRDLARAAITPHHMADDYSLNSSFYLWTLLTRTTPLTLLFGGIVVLWLLLKRQTPNAKIQKDVLWLLLAYIFFFVLMMTLGAKKGDRYVLPVWPAIDVLAAVGLVLAGEWMAKKRKAHPASPRLRGARSSKLKTAVLAAPPLLAVLYLGVVDYQYHPYAIAYSNPLFPDNLSQELGWGEGLEQVGAWLSEHDGQATVASWYPEELGAYTSAHVAHINAHEQPRVHYVVLYHNMFGRPADHPANDFIDEYYKKRKPVFVATIRGKEFAWVYEKETYERVIGELVAGVRAGQEVVLPEDSGASGIEIMTATYSGRAQQGQLVVQLKQSLGGSLLQEWRVPVADLEDNQWVQFMFPEKLELPGKIFVEVFAEGTTAGDAPTVRYSSTYNYRPEQFLLTASGRLAGSDLKKGDLAVRAR